MIYEEKRDWNEFIWYLDYDRNFGIRGRDFYNSINLDLVCNQCPDQFIFGFNARRP